MRLSRPRLLLLVNESGCFLSHRTNISQAALDAGFEVHVATRLTHDQAAIERHGVTVHPIDFPRNLRNPWVEWQAVRNLAAIYRRVQPDVIHHFSAKAILLGSMAARRIGAERVVNTFTGLGSAFAGKGWRAAGKRMLAARALRRALRPNDWRVTFQNPEDLRQLVGQGLVPAWKCHLIRGSGVDTQMFRPLDKSSPEPRVLFASRMIWPKGVAQFVDSARQLRQRGVKCMCELVGNPDPQNANSVPEERLWQWHHEGVIRWRGHQARMAQVLNEAAVVALPTYYGEGIPKILLEAAACGKPIVTTDIRGCREIVQHGRNGLLVPPHDSQRLADAIQQLVNNPKQCRVMGAEGRRIVLENFTAQQVGSQTLDLYSQIMGWPQAPSRQQRHAA